MAGLGSAWGSREEFLHPRDRHGRFRKKWQMAENVVNAISNFLDNFNPRTFQSDGQSGQYLFNRAKPSRFGGGALYPRLHADYDEANANLRAGKMDESTKKFVKMMDDSAINLDSDVILSRTVGPDAFGLTPEQMNLEDGGIEDFTGRLIADRGYSAANIGTPMSHGPGKITMSIAVPKGTKAIIPARSAGDRGIFLDRDQELRITKVKPDGTGGYYMLAVATPRTPGNTPEPINRSPRGLGLNPKEREARVLGIQNAQAKREGIISDAQINAAEIDKGTQQGLREQPAQLPPAQGAPTAPGGPEPRNEPVLKESIGGPSTTGKGTAEIAQTPPPEVPSAPEAPVAPRNFRDAVKEADIPVPSPGKRRVQWNKAYGSLTTGRNDPGDILRELESDIDFFRHLEADNQRTGHEDPHLAGDIGSLNKLADLISKEYGVQRRNRIPAASPVKKTAPSQVTPIAQAPGEKHRQIPGEVGTRKVTNLEAKRAAKAVQAPRAPQREEPTPPPVPKKAPELAKVLPIKKAQGFGPREGPDVVRGKTRATALKPGDRIMVETDSEGNVLPEMVRGDGRPATIDKVHPDGRLDITEADGKKVTTKGQSDAPGAQMPYYRKETATEAKRAAKKAAPPAAKKAAPPEAQVGMANEISRMARLIDNRPDDPVDTRNAPKLKAIATRLEGGPVTGTEQRELRDQLREIAKDYPNSTSGDNLDGWANALDKLRSQRAVPKFPSKTAPAAKKAAPAPETPDQKRERAQELIRSTTGMDEQHARPIRQEAERLTREADRADLGARSLAKKAAPAAPKVPEGNRIPVRGGGFVDTRTGELHGGPNAPTPETGALPDLNKKTAAELRQIAKDEGVPTAGLTRKDQFRQAILDRRTAAPRPMGVFSDNPAIRKAAQAEIERRNKANVPGRGLGSPDYIPNELNVTNKELQIIADHEGVPRRGRPTNKAKLQEAILANRAERATSGVAGTRRINTHGGAESTGLTTEQYNALSRYMGGGFGPANRSLRGRARQGDTATDAAVMDELMATSPMTEDKKVFRGLRTGNGIFGPRDQRPKDLTGFEWTDEGFVSTALNEGSAADFAKGPIGGEGGVLLRMNVPKGTNALDLRGGALNEDELLLQRGLRMRVTGEGGTRRLPDGSTARILDVEVLPPGAGRATRAVEPNAPAAQKIIQAPDRREAFGEDWINTPAMAHVNEKTAAGRSILEVRDDVLKGKITPDEGIRRLENDIDLNKQDLSEVEQQLRGDVTPQDRSRLMDARDKLRQGISDQENASSFMRKHFRQAPAVTPKEVEVHLDPEAKKLIDSAGPNDIREAAKVGGFGDLKGETKDELLKDLVKKIAGKELASRAAKKAVPKKLTPAPLVTKKSGDPDYVDARAIAEGLDMDESDQGMLKAVQDMLDGTGGEKVHTPAAAGRRLHELNNGAGSPSWERVVHSQLTLEKARDRVAGREPSFAGPEADRKKLAEAEAKDARLKAQSDRWNALAERLMKTRRRPARKATEPAPEKPKLTTEEKRVTAQAAEVLGVPKEQLQSRALAKKVAAAPAPEGAKSAVETMRTMQSREEGHAFLKNRTKADLQEMAKAADVSIGSKDTKQKIADQLVQWTIGRRLDSEAISRPAPPRVPGTGTSQILERINAVDADNVPVMSKKEVADLIANTRKADLVEMAKTYNVPSPSSKTAAELRTWIVDASVGNRIDSIATRGFTGSRPTQGPEGKALENLLPAQLAQIESELGIKRTSLDRAERIAAIKAAQAESNTQASIPKSLPSSGRKWDWATIQEDGGTMHGDSASMNLAQKLRKAGREDAAQYVADMRYRISNNFGEHDAADVEKMVADLKKMRDAEPDPAIKKAYDRALEDIDAPQSPAPRLPASTPEAIQRIMNELNQIPVARRTGHFAGTSKDVSAVDRLARLVRKVEAGDAGSIGMVEDKIRNILRSFHESVDGAYQMWRLESLIDSPDIRKWIRSFYPKT